ncbi:MAG: hypothetical protein RL684_54 [Pseudomonadota bacterium]
MTLRALLALLATLPVAASGASNDWRHYNGAPGGEHFSSLTQINRSNVAHLRQAWSYDLGESGARFECNPLVIDGVLYGFTPTLKVIALDAAQGTLRWKFDSGIQGAGPIRGLSYWTQGRSRRLFAGITHFLYALNPDTGRPIESFGQHGRVDLRHGFGGGDRQLFVAVTSPGVVYRDLIIVGFRTTETSPAPRGDIRAYDVHTGKLRWTFHTIPHPGEYGYRSWPAGAWRTAGGANNWAGMVVDERRGILYAPTGSAVPDFYGARRVGDDLFANSLLALEARTGRRLWHFQGVHHDLWDRDFPSPPVLVTVQRDGRPIDAVAQPSKQGFLFLFDRGSGRSRFPLEERVYPASDLPGEVASRTQPMPLLPEPFARQRLDEQMLTRRTPAMHDWAVQQFATMRSEGQFVPLSLDRQTVIFPGFDGGAEWGGAAVDPKRAVLYVNANDIAWTGGLARIKLSSDPIEALYQQKCLSCHGADRKGSPPAFPALDGIEQHRPRAGLQATIRTGAGRMPAFAELDDAQITALIHYVSTGERPAGADAADKESAPGALPRAYRDQGGEYEFTGYRKFLDPEGYPAVAPPWGTLNAVDLNTGQYLWRVPLGEYPALADGQNAATGSENYGGPVLTASGVLFIAATLYDHKLRAFDSDNGQLLQEWSLPYAGTATPATYSVSGRQFLVIATTGDRDASGPQGSAYVAFALP